MVDRQVQVTVERPHERVVLIRVTGVLDRGAAAALLRLLDAQAELVRYGSRDLEAVFVDLGGVRSFDAPAFRILRHARSGARRLGFELALTGCGGRVHLLPLAVQQMLSEHRTYPTVEIALAPFVRPAGVPTGELSVDFPEPRRPIERAAPLSV